MTTRFRATVLAAVMLATAAIPSFADRYGNSLAADAAIKKFMTCVKTNMVELAATNRYREGSVLAKDTYEKCRSEFVSMSLIKKYSDREIEMLAAHLENVANAMLEDVWGLSSR